MQIVHQGSILAHHLATLVAAQRRAKIHGYLHAWPAIVLGFPLRMLQSRSLDLGLLPLSSIATLTQTGVDAGLSNEIL